MSAKQSRLFATLAQAKIDERGLGSNSEEVPQGGLGLGLGGKDPGGGKWPARGKWRNEEAHGGKEGRRRRRSCMLPPTQGSEDVGDGISEDPPLRCESSQWKYGSCINKLQCVGEDDCRIREAGERELVLAVSVKCGKERDMTRGWQNVSGTPRLELRVMKSDQTVQCDVLTHSHLYLLYE